MYVGKYDILYDACAVASLTLTLNTLNDFNQFTIIHKVPKGIKDRPVNAEKCVK